MLKKIASIVSPELLKILCEMGHGDEIVFADGNFPSESVAKRIVRLDGHGVSEILTAVVEYFPIDKNSEGPVMVMATADGSVPAIWAEYAEILKNEESENFTDSFSEIERFAFYEQAKKAYCVVATGERALYGNIILRKGTC